MCVLLSKHAFGVNALQDHSSSGHCFAPICSFTTCIICRAVQRGFYLEKAEQPLESESAGNLPILYSRASVTSNFVEGELRIWSGQHWVIIELSFLPTCSPVSVPNREASWAEVQMDICSWNFRVAVCLCP